jgi:hypothetical protein
MKNGDPFELIAGVNDLEHWIYSDDDEESPLGMAIIDATLIDKFRDKFDLPNDFSFFDEDDEDDENEQVYE